MPWNRAFSRSGESILDAVITAVFGQVRSMDKISDHNIISGTLNIFLRTIKKATRKVHLQQKTFDSFRKGALKFAKENSFKGRPDSCSVQEVSNIMNLCTRQAVGIFLPKLLGTYKFLLFLRSLLS